MQVLGLGKSKNCTTIRLWHTTKLFQKLYNSPHKRFYRRHEELFVDFVFRISINWHSIYNKYIFTF